MQTTTSADGTTIAFESIGDGPPVVIVGGAFSVAADGTPLASALTEVGFSAITIDRRGRGASGDKRGTVPEDEVDDLAAVIEAVGGEPAVLGHSSGGVLALYAASRGVPISGLFLSEPPFGFGDGEQLRLLADRLQRLVDEGKGEDAVVAFQLEGVKLPREMVESIRQSDMFPALVPLAQSTVYDARLTAQLSTPTPQMLSVSKPVTILRGEQTFPLLIAAADQLAARMDAADLVIVPESVMHRPDPAATARVVRERA
ncbi:alpha/beta hydrolase [Microbacterium sp. LRZ72]|uniref:alpha/beta fold hydrolase n=1 Tax=Microbacterium sp. LRZ72 TaxID=2942481 RepID=UPI0029B96922|nr:alpha/beta hydrolase [Microbacterium sp. LRZ72]MDX2375922.1 alpha/beta hydrolase [Microbacterium sp. LRZ72]